MLPSTILAIAHKTKYENAKAPVAALIGTRGGHGGRWPVARKEPAVEIGALTPPPSTPTARRDLYDA